MTDRTGRDTALNDWVRAISTLAVVGVFSYKVYVTPIDLTIDFPTLLSLLLALFSVGLAALFYFKATETSNTFYDNSYNFTKDIAQLLAKIESGFGERLRHLDEGYSSMRDHLQKMPYRSDENKVEETKKKIEEERQEIEKVLAERNEIIQTLFERSQLQEEEKAKVKAELFDKEKEVQEAQRQLERMNRKLAMERSTRREMRNIESHSGLDSFTVSNVIERMGVDLILHAPPEFVIDEFMGIVKDLPSGYVDDLEKRGFYREKLTLRGFEYLRGLALAHG